VYIVHNDIYIFLVKKSRKSKELINCFNFLIPISLQLYGVNL